MEKEELQWKIKDEEADNHIPDVAGYGFADSRMGEIDHKDGADKGADK